MKKLTTTALLIVCSIAVKAQSSATQAVVMAAPNTVEIKFTGSGTTTGATVNLGFSTVNHYANGVMSADQQLSVSSNTNFTVAVKAAAANFTYTGTVSPAPAMPVSGVLRLMVSANGTGGSIVSPFSGYATLSSANQNLINTGVAGNAKLFSIKYKATPGFTYPAGTYAVNIVYTITQM